MDNDIEEVIRPLKVGLNNYGYCHNHDAAYRAAMIYSFIATCNKTDVNPCVPNYKCRFFKRSLSL
ncbi:MAG: hypothetical protein MSA02_01815 [Bacteroidales bacterium]|nr:hypothetical protein [Bacteroidales bacterium]